MGSFSEKKQEAGEILGPLCIGKCQEENNHALLCRRKKQLNFEWSYRCLPTSGQELVW